MKLTENGESDFLFNFLSSDDGLTGVISLVLFTDRFKDQVQSFFLLFHVDPIWEFREISK